jgi:BMFP domain-containing protein YqiC
VDANRDEEGTVEQRFLDDLARRLSDAMPGGMKDIQRDLEHNLRQALQTVFARMNLVTREEFEVQARVLARTRAKLDALERRVRELEGTLNIEVGDDAAAEADGE